MITSTLITLALAEYASRDDFHQIGKGSKIRHGLQWLFRAAVVALACWLDDSTLYAVPLAFLFSAVFRLSLNLWRGLDWRYVSPSSWYDWLWMRLVSRIYWDRDDARLRHLGRSKEFGWYMYDLHRAGLLAYSVELVVFGLVACFI